MPASLSPSPQPADFNELLAFLPQLYPEGAPIKAVVSYHDDHWPVYAPVVEAFFKAAGQDCWMDFNYDIQRAGEMLKDPTRVAVASLDEVKSMLTWCVRGERFCDGHHGSVIDTRYILRLLQRLNTLRQGYRGAEHPLDPYHL